MTAARAAVADLVGGDPGGVVFGPSATGGAVRAGIYHYNTADEVDRLLTALDS